MGPSLSGWRPEALSVFVLDYLFKNVWTALEKDSASLRSRRQIYLPPENKSNVFPQGKGQVDLHAAIIKDLFS